MKKGEETAGWKVQEVIILIGKLTFFFFLKMKMKKKENPFVLFFLFLVSLNEEHRRITNLCI